MGSRFSKPPPGTQNIAKQVLAKRAQQNALLPRDTMKGVAQSPEINENQIDNKILDVMKTWNVVHTTEIMAPTTDDSMGLASIVRHEEEKKLLAEKGYMGQLPRRLQGRVTENDLVNIYRILRDNRASIDIAKIANEFNVSKETIMTLDQVARSPTLVAENAIEKVGR